MRKTLNLRSSYFDVMSEMRINKQNATSVNITLNAGSRSGQLVYEVEVNI